MVKVEMAGCFLQGLIEGDFLVNKCPWLNGPWLICVYGAASEIKPSDSSALNVADIHLEKTLEHGSLIYDAFLKSDYITREDVVAAIAAIYSVPRDRVEIVEAGQ